MNQTFNFNIGSISIPYEIINKNKLKYIRINITSAGMKILKPNKVKHSEIEKILHTKADWILKHYNKFDAIKDKVNLNWVSGDKILYKGEHCEIKINPYTLLRTVIGFSNNVFTVYVNNKLSDEERKLEIQKQFKVLFKNMAQQDIEKSLEFYSKLIGVKYNLFKIRDQKTRWGSCSKKGNINLNWKLIMVPQWVMDYVIIHELCHLKHFNHSKEFWTMVNFYMPEHECAKKWLKDNTKNLVI